MTEGAEMVPGRFEVLETTRTPDREVLDVQITTAKAYPRSISRFVDECVEMATSTTEVAEECMYALPRDGKTIEGPSARLGEIVLSAWGNCAAGARVDREDGEFVYATGFFFDLQRNVRITREVRRRITDRHGRRYSGDMIAVTANAAASIAQRNATFTGIPKAFWIGVYKKVRHVVAGDEKTLATRRAEVFAYMQKRGVDEARVLAALKKAGIEDVGLDDFVILKGMVNSITEGEATVDELFPDPKAEERAKTRASRGVAGLRNKVKPEATDGAAATGAEGGTDAATEPAGQ